MKKILLLGSGSRKDLLLLTDKKDVYIDMELITIDFNKDHNPDIVHDLNIFPYPFQDNEFDEIHAYHILEHLGSQGDWKSFFDLFSELWRILKPNGVICAIVPSWRSKWAWGDPSHKRIINDGTLVFLNQEEYQKQIGKTPMSDFRFYYKANFEIGYLDDDGEMFIFGLRALK